MSDDLAKEKAAREAEERRRAGGPLEAKKPARNLSAGGLSGRGEVYGRTANREPVLDARTQAWVDEKQGKPSGPLPLDVVESGAEAIRAASGFTNPKGGSSDLLGGGASETVSNAFKPGDMRYEKPDGSGEVVSRNGADSTLAASLSPQLGLGFEVEVVEIKPPGLADKFIVPPFSVLDTRAGYWQERRRAWLSMGMRGETRAEEKALNTTAGQHQVDGSAAAAAHASGQQGAPSAREETYNDRALGASGRRQGMVYQHDAPGSDPGFYTRKRAVEAEIGRELTTAEFKANYYDRAEALEDASESIKTGTSVFDPVLCEVAYRWFSAPGALIIDPFAGGCVRGVIAGALARQYGGIELRPEQVADNRLQADALFDGSVDFGRDAVKPRWKEGDATRLEEYTRPASADLVFTCPPYADLGRYSDDPRNLSAMPYTQSRDLFAQVMGKCADVLKPDRFCVWVVGEVRGKDGRCYGFVSDTVTAARDAGLALYNEAILLNSVGSAALRAQRIVRTRKLTRVHQHVLVFVKGDSRKAAEACGSAETEM